MYRFLITLALVSALCFTGCSDDSSTPITPDPDTLTLMTKDDSVIANAYLVRDAAEAYAAANNGLYPRLTSEKTLDGQTLIDFLPDSEYLANPYDGLLDSPVDGTAARGGQVGYVSLDRDGDGVPDGYTIDALGENGDDYLIVIVKGPLEP
jgi:hypothetical protein